MNNFGQIKNNFISVYKPLVGAFVDKIRETNTDAMPELFLPSIGKNYPYVKYKLAFIGRDARHYGDLTDFVRQFKKEPIDCLFRNEGEFDELVFLDYTNNFGKSFWDYILQFLSRFYGVEANTLKRGEESEILKSFVWGNTNSISPHSELRNNSVVSKGNYYTIKDASAELDNIHNIINALSPDVLIVLNWQLDENYFNGKNSKANFEEVDEHLRYSQIEGKHVFWHAHPTWINMEIGYEKSLNNIINIVREKIGITENISLDIPSKEGLVLDERKEQIVKLAEYLSSVNHKMSGEELVKYCNRNGIKTTYDTDFVYGRGIYAFIRSVYNYCRYCIEDLDKAESVAYSFVDKYGGPPFE